MKIFRFSTLNFMVLTTIFAFGFSTFMACQKEIPKTADSTDFADAPLSVQDRSSEFLNLEWLKTFQNNLASALNDETIEATYSVTEICVGVESLVNMASPSSAKDESHLSSTNKFSLPLNGTTAEQMVTIYNSSYASLSQLVETVGEANAFLVMFDIQLDSVANKTAYLSVKSVLGVDDECVEGSFGGEGNTQPCDGLNPSVFPNDANYIMGAGDQELDLIDHWWSDWILDCNICQGIPSCPTDMTAPEEVEAAINHNFPKPVSPNPAKPYFWGFTDIDCIELWPYTTPSSYDLLGACDTDFKVGECMNSEQLHCWYCETFEHLRDNLAPIMIPAGKHFTSVNFALDWCVCGGTNSCQYRAKPVVEYCFGTPIFSNRPKPVWGTDPVTAIVVDPLP